jgi:hypothetical protein
MGQRQQDLYPLKEAAKIAHTLTEGERPIEPQLRWSYVIIVDKKKPDLAAIAVYDEDNKFIDWWNR